MFVAGVDAYSKVGLEDLAAGGFGSARAFQSRSLLDQSVDP